MSHASPTPASNPTGAPARPIFTPDPTSPDPVFTGSIGPAWIDDDSYRKFRDACFEAVSQVFTRVPAERIAEVGEAMALCIPKWKSLVDEGANAGGESVKYFDYEYYSEDEREDVG
jgi:hypothetical protein